MTWARATAGKWSHISPAASPLLVLDAIVDPNPESNLVLCIQSSRAAVTVARLMPSPINIITFLKLIHYIYTLTLWQNPINNKQQIRTGDSQTVPKPRTQSNEKVLTSPWASFQCSVAVFWSNPSVLPRTNNHDLNIQSKTSNV